MEENMKRILVVDDEQDLCEILKFNLETEGYRGRDCQFCRRGFGDGHCFVRPAAAGCDDGRNERFPAG